MLLFTRMLSQGNKVGYIESVGMRKEAKLVIWKNNLHTSITFPNNNNLIIVNNKFHKRNV